jgi:hypothetical protein
MVPVHTSQFLHEACYVSGLLGTVHFRCLAVQNTRMANRPPSLIRTGDIWMYAIIQFVEGGRSTTLPSRV